MDFFCVDHHKSDREYHMYCQECFDKIPGFLLRWWQNNGPAVQVEGEPATCEGCQRVAEVRASEE